MNKQRVSEFVKGNGNKITVGQYEIRELSDGTYWLQHESGEGTQVSRDALEAWLTQLYSEVF